MDDNELNQTTILPNSQPINPKKKTMDLPPLPKPVVLRVVIPDDWRYGNVFGYRASDLTAYATAAVIADRKARDSAVQPTTKEVAS